MPGADRNRALCGPAPRMIASRDTGDDVALHRPRRVALMLGPEGSGLSQKARAAADRWVRIPMEHGVDSLNVGAAAAVAFPAVAGGGPRG